MPLGQACVALPCYSPPVSSLPEQQPLVERIVLEGFMGSGKTTVGKQLALRLGWRFVDLDQAVALNFGKSVPEIFAEHGEPAFRVAEVRALSTLLQQPVTVIALGGGAPGTEAVRSHLQHSPGTVTVYLQAPFPLLYERCTRQAQDPTSTLRPLLGELASAQARFQLRQPWYAALAQHTVDVAAGLPEEITETIWRELQYSYVLRASSNPI